MRNKLYIMLVLNEDYKLFDNSVNLKLAEIIENKGLKVTQVAEGVKVHYSHISKILSSSRPISETLRSRLSAYLGTDF